MKPTQLIDFFQRARADKSLVVIEGVQALKHAVRFQATFENIITCDDTQLRAFLKELAPEVTEKVLAAAEVVDETTFNKLSPQPPRTKVIAIAHRKHYTLADLNTNKQIVFLEDPRDLENIGAVIRVSAAADIAGVVISGPADVWHPGVVRGAAGLHFALPVINEELDHIKGSRQIVSLDPTGKDSKNLSIEKNAILVFGTERHGISRTLLEKSDITIRLAMKEGVSSLNLATSVAATLYMM